MEALNATVRLVQPDEMEWVNECYRSIDFLPSDPTNEFIAIVEVDGERAGVARVVNIDSASQELGGVYVLPVYRGKGLAHRLVSFLLALPQVNKTLYCIPFVHLVFFYESFGFVRCETNKEVPKNITDKVRWCLERYSHESLLLVRS